jgi:hypothetical protein
MFGELALRFFLGGLSVSLFALGGAAWQPKTFAGIFGAAPSFAAVSLALAFHEKGTAYVALESRSMMLGAVAFIAYASICVVVAKQRAVSVTVGALLAWIAWLGIALGLVGVLQAVVG